MQSKIKLVVLLVVLGWALVVEADQSIRLPINSTEVTGQSALGEFRIEGVGQVELTAQRDGSRVVVLAVGNNGEVLGKAETVIGLKETPLYLQSENGLQPVILQWGGK